MCPHVDCLVVQLEQRIQARAHITAGCAICRENEWLAQRHRNVAAEQQISPIAGISRNLADRLRELLSAGRPAHPFVSSVERTQGVARCSDSIFQCKVEG